LLLVESLIHGLIAREVLSVKDAMEIIEVAADVTDELCAEPKTALTNQSSSALLGSIASSLAKDLVP
jgi:hypothetical protein